MQQSKLKKVEAPVLARKTTSKRFEEELAAQSKKLKKVEESQMRHTTYEGTQKTLHDR